MHDHIHFRDVAIGRRFKFDGERFEKTAEKIAWSITNVNALYKEWCFQGDEFVKVEH